MTVTRMQCCGIIEINGINGREPKDTLLLALTPGLHTPIIHKCGWVVFSQAYRPYGAATYGIKFKEYLEEHKLGVVVQLEATLNKNSMNTIDVFMWKVDHDALGKWYEENKLMPVEQVPGPTANVWIFNGASIGTTALNNQAGLLNPNPTVTGNL